MENQLITISICHNWGLYFLCAILGSLFVRLINSILRAIERGHSNFKQNLWICFKGVGATEPDTNDYWYTFILGAIEIAAYSVLMAAGKLEYIGAWLALKTVPQWGRWKEQRHIYNRFLIGNALVVIISYILTRIFFY